MLDKYKTHIEREFSTLKTAKLLIAFSGGIDSVVLTSLLNSLNYNIALAHCNFGLRGDESDQDAHFAQNFADNISVACYSKRFETKQYSKNYKVSTQMAARELRYQWFNELQEHFNFDYVLTAHHADDSIETFFINLLRGTGLKGLKGIPAINGSIIRTLLPFTRKEIENYANHNGLRWREDSSNSETNYLRNKIRHELIPKLKQLDPEFKTGILSTMQNLANAHEVVSSQITDLESERVIQRKEDEVLINIPLLLKKNRPENYLFYILNSYGFTSWNDINKLLYAQSGKYVNAPEWQLLKDRDMLILKKKRLNQSFFISFTKEDKCIENPMGVLKISKTNELPDLIKKSECYVDASKLNFPLTIRNWQKGDYFFPLNGNGRKKVSKYFKDQKKTIFEKSAQLLLYDANNAIIWILSERADDRFKVDKVTKHILKFTLE